MRKIEEIEEQIQKLSREIEADAKAGKLDHLISEARADFPEILGTV